MQQHDGFRILWRTFVAQVDLHPIDRDELRWRLRPAFRQRLRRAIGRPSPHHDHAGERQQKTERKTRDHLQASRKVLY
jgi:hypothetical protein